MARLGASYGGKPIGLKWRSSKGYIISTVAIGLFTDLFLYGLIVPIIPFILHDRLDIPHSSIQTYSSILLACYAGAQVLFSIPAGLLADRLSSRQLPFLCGIAALFGATVLLWVGQKLWVLVLARVLQGISASVVWTVGMALIMDTIGMKKLGMVIGTIFSVISVGELVAPVMGGVVYGKVGEGAVFGIALGILALDFLMRLVLIEKKCAAKYEAEDDLESPSSSETSSLTETDAEDEESPLIAKGIPEEWIIPSNQPSIMKKFPILFCLQNPRFLTAQATTCMQATLLAIFDATVPTEAVDEYGFDSLRAGLLFIPLVMPYLIMGPLAGRAVDKYGTKLAVIGFMWMVPPLVLLRFTSADNVALYCVLLAFSGVGLAIISSPSLVEATYVVRNYHKANKDFFGEKGPYAQMYALNSMFFCTGLTVGPVVGGILREKIGYGNMNATLAGSCFVIGIIAFLFMGGRPKFFRRT